MVLAFGVIKLSITFFYRRIFVTARGTIFDWVTRAAIAIVILWTIGCLISFLLSCGTHLSANWGSVQDGLTYCGPSANVDSAFVVSDLITDVMVLCLPLPVVSTRSRGSYTDIAKVVDLEPANDDGKETDSYRYFSNRRSVSGHSSDIKLMTVTEMSKAPSWLQLSKSLFRSRSQMPASTTILIPSLRFSPRRMKKKSADEPPKSDRLHHSLLVHDRGRPGHHCRVPSHLAPPRRQGLALQHLLQPAQCLELWIRPYATTTTTAATRTMVPRISAAFQGIIYTYPCRLLHVVDIPRGQRAE